MTHAAYVFAGWGLGLGVIGLYAASVIRRGRSLSRHVPADRRRWLSAEPLPADPGPSGSAHPRTTHPDELAPTP